MLKLFIFIALSLNIYANTTEVKKLQNEFHKNVLETKIFRKRYEHFFSKTCGDDFTCIKKTVDRLKTWKSVKNDRRFKNVLKKYLSKVEYNKNYWNRVLKKLKTKKTNYKDTQFVSVIDLNKQQFLITLWDNKAKTYRYIGQDLISSGNINREKEVKRGQDHYLKTPAGIFVAKNGWRSDGKYNSDKVSLPYGYKDRFIFYLGEHQTIRYNSFDKEGKKIHDKSKWKIISDKLNLAVHSHKSYRKLGTPNSHGCVRMSDELNRFLDNNLVLHKQSLKNQNWINRFSKQPNNPKHYDKAGEYLIIFDKI